MNKAFHIFLFRKQEQEGHEMGGYRSGGMLDLTQGGRKKFLIMVLAQNNKSYLKPQLPGKKYQSSEKHYLFYT